jgi:TrmH family RNA methyltransferase
MVSKKQIQLVNSLKQKKYREEHQLFIAEGAKIVPELLRSDIKVEQVFATREFLERHTVGENIECIEVKYNELERLSAQTTPSDVLAVCKIPVHVFDKKVLKGKLTLVLDDIKDPGNLGTIIRIADWFGIDTIICSKESADAYNPKVVQATMGSIARINLHYLELSELFSDLNTSLDPGKSFPIYGALLEGEDLYKKQLSEEGIIVIGNESRGISGAVEAFVNQRITIPSFAHYKSGKGEAESLNAAIATAIICSEFRRG